MLSGVLLSRFLHTYFSLLLLPYKESGSTAAGEIYCTPNVLNLCVVYEQEDWSDNHNPWTFCLNVYMHQLTWKGYINYIGSTECMS